MGIVAIVLGLLVGAALASIIGEDGAWMPLFGAAGYLIYKLTTLSRQLERTQQRLDAAEAQLSQVDLMQRASPAKAEAGYGAVPGVAQAATQAPGAASEVASPLDIPTVPQALPEPAPTSETADFVDAPAKRPAQARSAAPPRKPPQEPAVLRWIREYFTGGNTVVRVGVIVLFFGVAFLLKYAAQRVHVPIQLRLIGVAIGAIALLVIGWRLREKRPGFALSLQGGAIGMLYLTVFAALRLYHLLPAGLAFGLLFAIAAFSAVLAVTQNSLTFALLGVSGGFLAPILTSTGQGSHVMLFSYYAMLNLGIAAVSWFKAWRPLNVAGFIFTFVIGSLWGAKYYRPELFASTEPFLIFFFVLYVAIAMLFASRQAPQLKGYVDGTLVFGVPIVAFGLQALLVRRFEFGMAYSALAVGAFYLILARLLWSRRSDTYQLLVEAFLALGVIFTTLAVPLALEGRWTSAVWALEGAGIVWVAVKQNRLLARWFGMLLQIGAAAAFLLDLRPSAGATPLLNSTYVGTVLVSLAGLFSAWMLHSHRDALRKAEHIMAPLMFAWGLWWWFGGGVHEIERHVAQAWAPAVVLIFVALSCAVLGWLRAKLAWRYCAVGIYLLLAAALLVLLQMLEGSYHPLAHGGWLAWPLAIAVQYWLLHRADAEHEPLPAIMFLHSAGLWLMLIVACAELRWWVNQWVNYQGSWANLSIALLPALALLWLARKGEAVHWPIAAHARAYLEIGAAPIAGWLAFWSLWIHFVSDGNPAPLPYLPFINPLDLVQALVLLALIVWVMRVRQEPYTLLRSFSNRQLATVLAVLAFVWLNAVLLRTMHYWAGVAFDFDVMLRSRLVQAAFSIFWTALAFAIMLYAKRHVARPVWFVGAALLGIVVLKLFTIDIAGTGGLERVVSFIGVALLMLVIGYVAPLPPRETQS